MQALRDAGKHIVLISNSSKRSDASVANLEKMGIERSLYDTVITSGEIAWQAMKSGDDPYYAGLGRRCLMSTWGGDNSFLEGQDLEEVDSLDDAEFVLLSGTSGADASIYDEMLQAAAARNLPMLCLNRDMVSVDPEGRLVDCSGKVAQRYESFGGKVRYHGKPGREIYEACLAAAPSADRPIAVGDSLHHDIAGAAGMGIDSIFVTAGIHRFELGVADGECPDADAVARVAEEYGVTPTFTMPSFVW
jgi:HAD superfamily hydrolase (TIGR01459 family)